MRGKELMPKPATCPMCKQSPVEAFTPFCSKRCADLDLGKWFTGAYAIPGEPADQADENPTGKPDSE